MSQALTQVVPPSSADLSEIRSMALERIIVLRQNVLSDVISIGVELKRVKETLQHGQFLPWLRENLAWKERTAQNFMAVADRLGQKAHLLAYLPMATNYQLASSGTPDELRADILGKIEGGHVLSDKEIKTQLASRKRTDRAEREEAKRLASQTPAAKARAKQIKAQDQMRREKEQQARSAAEHQRQIAIQNVDNLLGSKLDHAEYANLISLLLEAGYYYVANDLNKAKENAQH